MRAKNEFRLISEAYDRKVFLERVVDGTLMCPEACCGAPVMECKCGPNCPHCNCFMIQEAVKKNGLKDKRLKIPKENKEVIKEAVPALVPAGIWAYRGFRAWQAARKAAAALKAANALKKANALKAAKAAAAAKKAGQGVTAVKRGVEGAKKAAKWATSPSRSKELIDKRGAVRKALSTPLAQFTVGDQALGPVAKGVDDATQWAMDATDPDRDWSGKPRPRSNQKLQQNAPATPRHHSGGILPDRPPAVSTPPASDEEGGHPAGGIRDFRRIPPRTDASFKGRVTSSEDIDKIDLNKWRKYPAEDVMKAVYRRYGKELPDIDSLSWEFSWDKKVRPWLKENEGKL